jgi:pyruvate/2-oxoacid:ferredoxin oxidoreductase alpha subunit
MKMAYKNFDEIVNVAMLHPEYIRPFFDMVVENCAQLAEEQARVYDGSNKEGSGCHAAASAIRLFGKKDE